jgi:hypothetical protein
MRSLQHPSVRSVRKTIGDPKRSSTRLDLMLSPAVDDRASSPIPRKIHDPLVN